MDDNRDPLNYAWNLIGEECAETASIAFRGNRFGRETPSFRTVTGGVAPSTPLSHLHLELGDVLAAIRYGVKRGLIDNGLLLFHAQAKIARLLDPNAVDNLGRRLAP